MDIRSEFLSFFKNKGHKIYDSMPLVPDDASLLFTNAGMVQFKDIFTGKLSIPNPPRATSSQLCMRAGGKHNDLENVGYTARHHTLFEMLGNFSFGDYFKEQAIAYAWEFVTEVLNFDKEKLYISVHKDDEEAYKIWSKFVNPKKIAKMSDKDNFWQMGDIGPCGPCSEIYIDQGEKFFNSKEDYFGGEGDRFLEIWNLVFMQYERDSSGKLSPLPKPSIDTGMGLERIIALKEGKINNFDTSIFAPLMREIENLTQRQYVSDDEFLNKSYDEKQTKAIKETQASFRVIADHARSVVFLLAQGVYFEREGRGYVLRRILRRAVRHGYLLGLKEPFLHKVIKAVCESMQAAYPYLKENQDHIIQQCKGEEERFFETIDSGMSLFYKELQTLLDSKGLLFSGDVAFKLYDTYGFPLDLTQDMLRSENLEVDISKFEQCMNEQKTRSKASWKGSGDAQKLGDFKELLEEFGENEFIGYEAMSSESKILALLDSSFKHIDSLPKGAQGYVLFDKTPLYAESGGAIGDKGVLLDSNHRKIASITDTKKYFGLNISSILCDIDLHSGQSVIIEVDSSRYEIAKHHSATHLLHLSLRKILGSHITQAGSLVESNRLRFDFSHPKALNDEQLRNIESDVNAQILQANEQICEIMDIDTAKAKGAIALFGEKYGDNVRVVKLGESIELCGGIHIKNTAHIGSFYIIKEGGVSSGVRRIEAICGKAGYEYAKSAIEQLKIAKESLKAQDLIAGIDKLKKQLKELKDKASQAEQNIKSLEFEQIGHTKLIVLQIKEGDIKSIVDKAKNELESVAILLITESSDKIMLAAGIKNAPLKANEWIKEVALILGGNGGGKEDFATAGGKDKTKIDEALMKAKMIAKECLSSNNDA